MQPCARAWIVPAAEGHSVPILTTLVLTAEDRGTIVVRGFDCPAQVAATLCITHRLDWLVPCAGEALQMTIRYDAVIDHKGLTFEARVTALRCRA